MSHEPPWKVVREFPGDYGSTLVHLHNVSGGLLSGDQLAASIELGEACEAQITSTGSTRIYKSKEHGRPASQEFRATIERGAILEYLPDSIIPFAGSRYKQRSTYELFDDAGLFAWEIVAPGRSGEKFSFEDLQIETEIRSAATPVAFDCWRLQPRTHNLEHAIRMGPFTYHATLYICRTRLPRHEWLRWEQLMSEIIETIPATRQTWGVSALPKDGIVFRGLATEGLYLADSLVLFWRRMKRELYGREAVLPRKMF
jgi:urease accessory protein